MSVRLNSHKGFKFAILAIGFFLVFVALKVLVTTENISIATYTNASAFIMLVVIICSIVGFIFSIKGRKDPNSIKKIIGLIINSILVLLFIATIVANVIDIQNSFS
ncbi:hypothetical protein A9Q86_09375 [Flavobacteriales bacterium 33_180_T64]|nr:hypothetical protein A9Q86_09375 [Flavobacteriales bacterium 33_180_T64]